MTLFNDIFDQFLLTIDDSRFTDNLTPDVLANTLSKYLYRAIAIFADYCYKDLTDYTATTNEIYEFTADGETSQFTLSPTPPTNCEFYISVNDVENTNYTFNSSTNVITFSGAIANGSTIYISAYKTGSFTPTLNIQEISLLARAMIIPWLEFMLLKKKHLDQIVYGKNMMVHSQANQTQVNKETLQMIRDKIESDMMYYTYKQSDDDLSGINGYNYLDLDDS